MMDVPIASSAMEKSSSCYDALNLQRSKKGKQFRDPDHADVDITVAIADIGDVDVVGGSFRAKFTVNAFYLFQHASQVMEPSFLGVSSLVAGKRNPFALPPIVQALGLPVPPGEMDEDQRREAKVSYEKRDMKGNVFFKLLDEKKERTTTEVQRDGRTYVHRTYHLNDDEQQQFSEFYYLPSITIVNEQEQHHPLHTITLHSERIKSNTFGDGSNTTTNTNGTSAPSNNNNNNNNNNNSSSSSSSSQESSTVIWVMWRYRCDSTLKENFELACFPFDQQRLSMDLRIDDDDIPFNLYIRDVRLQKLAVDNTEYVVLEPEIRHFHSKFTQVGTHPLSPSQHNLYHPLSPHPLSPSQHTFCLPHNTSSIILTTHPLSPSVSTLYITFSTHFLSPSHHIINLYHQLSVRLRRYHIYYVIHMAIVAAAISSLGRPDSHSLLSMRQLLSTHTFSTHTLSIRNPSNPPLNPPPLNPPSPPPPFNPPSQLPLSTPPLHPPSHPPPLNPPLPSPTPRSSLTGLIAFSVDMQDVATRTAINLVLLLILVSFKGSIQNKLPAVSYTTRMDHCLQAYLLMLVAQTAAVIVPHLFLTYRDDPTFAFCDDINTKLFWVTPPPPPPPHPFTHAINNQHMLSLSLSHTPFSQTVSPPTYSLAHSRTNSLTL